LRFSANLIDKETELQFLTGKELYKAVQNIASGTKPRFAVAFWGQGAKEQICDGGNKDIQIICNLKMGATNPFVIEDILGRRVPVRQHDILHAKVYLNETAALVASANASANGLGFEGAEQASWEEAGLFIDEPQAIVEIKRWFTRMWGESREINEGDLERAKATWRARQGAKPSLGSFADLDVNALSTPLIDWFGDNDWDTNAKYIKGKTRAAADYLEKRIADGIELEGTEDRKVLTPGTWVLCFRRTRKGQPDRREGLSWVCLGKILDDAFKYTGERKLRSVALAAERRGTEPFPITKRFQDSFVRVISRDEFEQLRTDEYDGAWFTAERLKLTRSFWATLHSEYTGPGTPDVEAAA